MTSRADREREHFDTLAADRGAAWWGSTTKAGQARLDARSALAIRHARLGPGRLVLEPGAGSGEFTKRIAASGASVVGIDISPRQVGLARRALAHLPAVRMEVGDVEHLEFEAAHFDAVVGNSVLHHLTLDRALAELHRVLKPGGHFFFLEPNMLNPQVALERNVRWVGKRLQNSEDETAFVRWRLARSLKRAAFRRVWIRPFDFLHPAIPERWIGAVATVSRALSATPGVREIAGSLQVYAER